MKLMIVMLGMVLLVGCGQKGDLYFPKALFSPSQIG